MYALEAGVVWLGLIVSWRRTGGSCSRNFSLCCQGSCKAVLFTQKMRESLRKSEKQTVSPAVVACQEKPGPAAPTADRQQHRRAASCPVWRPCSPRVQPIHCDIAVSMTTREPACSHRNAPPRPNLP
ncbi:hypothetical protein SNOG_20065 [Parastagonospora nodorum SN15]|uniref:Uncharacterized protein n=1 Tax=Phaeosphaeria nodorum (strain SN15 / ATCC MYA-4574 / FGSC 10173) TaxID=321614 RepID=A9JX56_PHANO|nr:hypothetical protein SNOG_20065 [Parastagonospora nodorum SN15]EDP89921.1 hypothetical protein SNOG_20065 [Parastagonospora nodorum SN15]